MSFKFKRKKPGQSWLVDENKKEGKVSTRKAKKNTQRRKRRSFQGNLFHFLGEKPETSQGISIFRRKKLGT